MAAQSIFCEKISKSIISGVKKYAFCCNNVSCGGDRDGRRVQVARGHENMLQVRKKDNIHSNAKPAADVILRRMFH